MKDKIILKDETLLELEAGASLSDIRIKVGNASDMAAVFNLLTDENLSEITVKNGQEVVVAIYKNCTLVNMSASAAKDGMIMCSLNIREKTDTEIRLEQLEQEVGQLTGKTESDKEE